MDGDRQTVTVSLDSVEAYAEPQFVLEFDGKIYVTVGVIEFDPDDSDMDDDEKADFAELQGMLAGGRPVSGTVVGAPQEASAMAQSQTGDEV